MTVIPHAELERALEAADELVDASEAYLAFVRATVAELAEGDVDDRVLMIWRAQERRMEAFVELLDDEVLERARELVDRTAVMETARKGDFV